ncbi:hypothetical protein G6F63_015451 [Rhizopus arrhizus]|nr:hypothetical protein G6F63_015451 [Rhizopus arrhizus]
MPASNVERQLLLPVELRTAHRGLAAVDRLGHVEAAIVRVIGAHGFHDVTVDRFVEQAQRHDAGAADVLLHRQIDVLRFPTRGEMSPNEGRETVLLAEARSTQSSAAS